MSDPDLTIEFGDPPAPSSFNGANCRYAAAAKALRERKGQWARISAWDGGKPDTSLASTIRKGGRGFAPAGAFDARSRKNGDRFEVWAVFIGEPAASPSTPRPTTTARPPAAPPRPPAPRPAPTPSQSIVRDLRTSQDDSILCASCGHAKLRHDGTDAPACSRVGCTCSQYRKPTA